MALHYKCAKAAMITWSVLVDRVVSGVKGTKLSCESVAIVAKRFLLNNGIH